MEVCRITNKHTAVRCREEEAEAEGAPTQQHAASLTPLYTTLRCAQHTNAVQRSLSSARTVVVQQRQKHTSNLSMLLPQQAAKPGQQLVQHIQTVIEHIMVVLELGVVWGREPVAAQSGVNVSILMWRCVPLLLPLSVNPATTTAAAAAVPFAALLPTCAR